MVTGHPGQPGFLETMGLLEDIGGIPQAGDAKHTDVGAVISSMNINFDVCLCLIAVA